jgi:hypothetical protein
VRSTRVTHDIGLYMPLSLVKSNGRTLFMASQGFYMMGESSPPVPIGRERSIAKMTGEPGA